MTQDTQIVLPFARLCGKNLQADFEGGTLSSDGGVLLLREIETQVGIVRRGIPVKRDISYHQSLSAVASWRLRARGNSSI